jgi:hypothetical protein
MQLDAAEPRTRLEPLFRENFEKLGESGASERAARAILDQIG